jgi:hypothetical protein
LACIDRFRINKNKGVRAEWGEVVFFIRKTTAKWWKLWCKTNPAVDELPKVEDVTRLGGELYVAVEKGRKVAKEKPLRAPQEERQTIRGTTEATSVMGDGTTVEGCRSFTRMSVDGTKQEGWIPVKKGRSKLQTNSSGNRSRSSHMLCEDEAMSTKRHSVQSTIRPALETPKSYRFGQLSVRSTNFTKVIGEGEYAIEMGQAAMSSIKQKIISDQEEHKQKRCKHGRQLLPGQFNWRHKHDEPPRLGSEPPRLTGLALVFRLFSEKIKKFGDITNASRCLQQNWGSFGKEAQPCWQLMSELQKREHLYRFLSKTKFPLETSHDPQVMSPDKGCKRKANKLGGKGFAWNEKEVGELVEDIMKDYGLHDNFRRSYTMQARRVGAKHRVVGRDRSTDCLKGRQIV